VPSLQGKHDARLGIITQQCLWDTPREVIEATFTIKVVVNLVYHATYPN
jgi:hypothetical protein